jgi:transcriptional regulator with XRE-family HTH domain
MPSPSAKPRKHRKTPDPAATVVGERVRRLRDEKEFTFDAFVEECGLGRGYVSELERGLVVPSLHALQKLAAALEVTVADLVLGDSDREKLYDATRKLPEAEVRALLEQVLPRLGK